MEVKLIVLLCALFSSSSGTTDNNVYELFSKSKPGHVIALLPHDINQQVSSRFVDSSGSSLSQYMYFSLVEPNLIVTNGNVTQLQGRTFPVYIQHTSGIKHWKSEIIIKVISYKPNAYFDEPLYRGTLFNNGFRKASLHGLEQLEVQINQFPKDCSVSVISADTQVLKIATTANGLLQFIPVVTAKMTAATPIRVILKVECLKGSPAFTQVEINVNKNTVQFEQDFYSRDLNLDEIAENPYILQVKATSNVASVPITYHLQNTDIFRVNENDGTIYVDKPIQISPDESYQFQVIAKDIYGYSSKPTTVRIHVEKSAYDPINAFNDEIVLSVHKRALRNTRRFFIYASQYGELFSVASIPAVAGERYALQNGTGLNITLDNSTGMVSRKPSTMFTGSEIQFKIIITKDMDTQFLDEQDIFVVISWDSWEEPIFTNEPNPMWARIPIWIRPFTTIYTVQAKAAKLYNVPVRYKLESGGNNQFTVHELTGEVKINYRGEFTKGDIYALAISAQCVGAARSRNTSSQVLYVKVEDVNPQFYYTPYVINFTETSNAGDKIGELKAVSFQELKMFYAWEFLKSEDSTKFSLNPETGAITLMKKMVYIELDRVQFRMTATVTENFSNFKSTVNVIINLIPANLHAPYFPVTHYVAKGVDETNPIGSEILRVTGVDLDPGRLGYLYFTTNHKDFYIDSTDGKIGVLRNKNILDYDLIGPEHMYEFVITATDMDPVNPRSGTATVQVWMSNANDEEPVFYPVEQRVHLTENTDRSVGFIHYVQAYDPDGDGITFRFSSSNTGCTANKCRIFDLDTQTGKISLNSQVPPQSEDLVLDIDISDDSSCCPNARNSAHTTKGKVYINYVGVNHPPSIPECPSYLSQTAVKEQMPIDTVFMNITAKDEDPGINGKVKFSLIFEFVDRNYFEVRQTGPYTAELYTKKSFDRENPEPGSVFVDGKVKYGVTVLVEDEGLPKLSTTCFFFVTIIDINDKDPIFDRSKYDVTIDQATGMNQRVMRVWAVDEDEGPNAEVSYSIESQPNLCTSNCFNIDRKTGWITIATSLPDTMTNATITVLAQDGGQIPRKTNSIVSVIRTRDKNSLPPVWEMINGTAIDDIIFPIKENIGLNTKLNVALSATIPGSAGEATYFLSFGRTKQENSKRDFQGTPNGSTGKFELFTANNLDNAEAPSYILSLIASRRSSTSTYSYARLRISVLDVNDKRPIFQGFKEIGKYKAAVSDKTVKNDLVITVIAIDLDTTSPNNKVRYRWGAECELDCKAFILETDTGNIRANGTFNRKSQPEYLLTVEAYDGANSDLPNSGNGPNMDRALVSVLVLGPSEKSPTFSQPRYDFNVLEGRKLFTSVANVTATNLDPDFNYPQYIISKGNEKHTFAVDSNTGNIVTTGDLLYSTKKDYVLTYNVFDGRDIDTTEVVINLTSVNMYPPVFQSPVYSNNDYTETQITTLPAFLSQVSATDPDGIYRRTAVSYSLEGAFVTSSRFEVNSTGAVFLKEGGIDRDYPKGYANWQINVIATDENSASTSRKGYSVLNLILRDINDNAPFFNVCCIAGFIKENSIAGSTVLQLKAIDFDMGANAMVSFQAFNIPKDANNNDIFTMDSTGLIKTTSSQLDREVRDSYSFTVRASDGGSNSQISRENQTVYITVTDDNDHTPTFDTRSQNLQINMPEEIPVGGYVNYVQGIDEDIGDNAKLTFEIAGGRSQEYFYMDSIYASKTGAIKILKPVSYEGLPAGDKTLQILISVKDPTKTSLTTATVTITVLDVNDNAPTVRPVNTSVSVREDVAVGFEVATFTAEDPDTLSNGQFSFFIDYENTDRNKQFSVDRNSGKVTVRNPLNRETTAMYNLHILAVDKGLPPKTGTATLTVSIIDVNDNAPQLIQPSDMVVVDASTRRNSKVADIKVVDPDSAQTVTVTYCTNPGCEDFTYTSTGNGVGELRANLNGYSRVALNNRKYYDLTFTMRDSGTPSKSATGTLRVTIASSNNEYQMVEAGSTMSTTVYNYMRQFKDVPCGYVYVNDMDDTWDIADKTFTCTSGCETNNEGRLEQYFSVNKDDGKVLMLEGATKGDHTLTVSVFDNKWKQTIKASVNVKVIYIEQDAVLSSGSIRLQGVTVEEMIQPSTDGKPSKMAQLKTSLSKTLGVPETYVDIFTVLEVQGEEGVVDVQYSAHGSPYYSPAKLNGVVIANKSQIASETGLKIMSAPVDECLIEKCFSGGCTNRHIVKVQPLLVTAGSTSFAGINTTFGYECACKTQMYTNEAPVCDAYSCYNGGNCTQNWNGFTCTCPEGYEGPRCQNTKISLDGQSWAWFESLGTSQCSNFRLSFEFITTTPNGLILYNGPMSNLAEAPGLRDFISVELNGGKAKARIDLGDGEKVLNVNSAMAKNLADGQWHTIEIVKEYQTVRLVVDHCEDSIVTESVNTTSTISNMCQASDTFTGDQFLLNVYTPLELGGRAKPQVDYPQGLPTVGFNGCVKNLRYLDMLYNLELSVTQKSGNPSNICSREQGCVTNGNTQSQAASTCPLDSSCEGNFNNANKQCVCHLGKTGVNCNTDTTTKDYEGSVSFVEWELRPQFNASLDPKAIDIWLRFRTRTENGVLFLASSFSTLELIQIEVKNTHLLVRYDLGSNERFVELSHVNVSDGIWHNVYVSRYGSQLLLKLDHGDGKYLNQTLPRFTDHQLLYIADEKMTYGGAHVFYKKFHTEPTVTNMLIATCVSDYRINQLSYLPLDSKDDTTAARIANNPGMIDGCPSNACANVNCPAPQICTDRWRMPFCVCPAGYQYNLVSVCSLIVDCSIPRCAFGDCVTVGGMWRCNCWEGYYGAICDKTDSTQPEKVVGLAAGSIIAIVVCILAVILIVLIAVLLACRTKSDPLLIDPKDDIRENIVCYDEEGAGEEDMHAYDLSRLQKPKDPDMLSPAGGKYPLEHVMPAGAEPMSDPRRQYPHGDRPGDVGDFIGDRLRDADNDPNAPPYDSVREYEYEGGGSSAGSLSSLQSSSSGDLDFDYLNNFGPRFQKLADMYGAGQPDEED